MKEGVVDPRVGFWEIQVVDVELARVFYTQVFGLDAEPFGERDLMLTTRIGDPVGALIPVETTPPTDGFFRPTFDTDELEASLDRVVAAGGSVIQERTEIGDDYGWWAAIADPFGNRLQLSTGLPR